MILRNCFLIFFGFVLSCSIVAQSPEASRANKFKLGDSPAEMRAAAVLETVQSGDEVSIRKLINEQVVADFRDAYPMEQHISAFKRMHENIGGAEVAAIMFSQPNSVDVTLKLSSGKYLKLSLQVAAEAPHLITMMGFGPGEAPSGAKGPSASTFSFSSFDDLDAQLRQMTDADKFSGVVVATKNGQAQFQKAYGFADRTRKISNQSDTLFDVGSINKQFTGVAVLKLAQEGRLNLDDPLGKFLKGFPPEIANRVTIRQLLQHRSGWGDYLDYPKFVENPARFRTVNDYLELIRTIPLEFEPGSKDRYSNIGFAVLGGVIEAVTGRSYFDVVSDVVYGPAGMKSTGSFARGASGKNMAIGYTRLQSKGTASDQSAPLVSNSSLFPPSGSPAGGGYSNAEDLRLFVLALLENRLLDKEHTALLLNRYSPPSGSAMRARWGFAGGAQGVSAVVLVDLVTRDTVVVLANLDMPVSEGIGDAIFRHLNQAVR